jgi:hypothetical protein
MGALDLRPPDLIDILDDITKRIYDLEQRFTTPSVVKATVGNQFDTLVLGPPSGTQTTLAAPASSPTNLILSSSSYFDLIYINASWTAPVDGSAVDYQLQWAKKLTGGVYDLPSSQRISGTSGRIQPLEPNTTYGVRVMSVNKVGTYSTPLPSSNYTDITTGADSSIPHQITGVAISRGATTAVVTFNAADPLLDPDVANGKGLYRIQLSTSNTFTTIFRQTDTNSVVVAFNDITAESSYYARVAAIDSSGNIGPWSSVAGPATVGGVNDSMIIADLSAAKITAGFLDVNRIQANTITTAKLSVTMALVTGQSMSSSSYSVALSPPSSLTVTAAGTGTSLTNGYYAYTVTAVNALGETNQCTEVVQYQPGAQRFDLSWGAVSGATSYRVYGRRRYEKQLIATVTAPTTTYSDTGSVAPSGFPPLTNTTGAGWQVKADGTADYNSVIVRGTFQTALISGDLTLQAGGVVRSRQSGQRVEIGRGINTQQSSSANSIDAFVLWGSGSNTLQYDPGLIYTDDASLSPWWPTLVITAPTQYGHETFPAKVTLRSESVDGASARRASTISLDSSIVDGAIFRFDDSSQNTLGLNLFSNRALYWGAWGGGWYMQDATYMRCYGDKQIYTNPAQMGPSQTFGSAYAAFIHNNMNSTNSYGLMQDNTGLVYIAPASGQYLVVRNDNNNTIGSWQLVGSNTDFRLGNRAGGSLPPTLGGSTLVIATSSGEVGISSSSRTVKAGIRSLDNSGEQNPVWHLRPVRFRWDPEKVWNAHELPETAGLVAEEVHEVAADGVHRNPSGEAVSLNEQALIAYLVDAVHYLRDRLDAVEQRPHRRTLNLEKRTEHYWPEADERLAAIDAHLARQRWHLENIPDDARDHEHPMRGEDYTHLMADIERWETMRRELVS